MVQANELRIGNFIIIDNEVKPKYYYEITAHDIEEIDGYGEDAFPITITTELLEKTDFKNYQDYMNYEVGKVIFHYDKRSGILGLYTNDEGLADGIICTKEYLHQLQNLYFYLTGKEIKINL